jgi:predicted Zn-dependent protease
LLDDNPDPAPLPREQSLLVPAAMPRQIPLPSRVCLFLVLVLGAGGSAGGCSISKEQEIQIGQESRGQFEQEFGGRYPDPRVQQYAQDVGMRLVRRAGRTDLPWEFRVLNSDVINAFALPGGFVYITRGLLFKLNDEAEMAGVLGHEAGHVVHRHSVQQLQRAQLVQGGFALATLLGGQKAANYADLAQLVSGLVMMKYSREQEKEADLSGLDYMTREGYDPTGIVRVMELFKRESKEGGPPEFLSSHPDPGNREEYLTKAIQSKYARLASQGKTNREQFQQIVRSSAAARAR